jgi:hypothetical protein
MPFKPTLRLNLSQKGWFKDKNHTLPFEVVTATVTDKGNSHPYVKKQEAQSKDNFFMDFTLWLRLLQCWFNAC